MAEQKLAVQVYGHDPANEAKVRQAVENALTNLTTLLETDGIEISGPQDIEQIAAQMIRASMDRMRIADVIGLNVTCVGVN
jgi:hypothetical protein